MKNVLMVLTSHDQLGDTGKKTGFWLEEFAAPYYTLKDAGANIVPWSRRLGGQPPLDPKSDEPDVPDRFATRRFEGRCGRHCPKSLASTLRKLGDGQSPGRLRRRVLSGRPRPPVGPGRGQALDRPDRSDGLAAEQTGRRSSATHRACCVMSKTAGRHGRWSKGKKVTGFTNTEEEGVGLTQGGALPGRRHELKAKRRRVLERRRLGNRMWCTDGTLITGQNPASSADAAALLLKQFA